MWCLCVQVHYHIVHISPWVFLASMLWCLVLHCACGCECDLLSSPWGCHAIPVMAAAAAAARSGGCMVPYTRKPCPAVPQRGLPCALMLHCCRPAARHMQELTKSMGTFGFDILQALVNDIAPAHKVGRGGAQTGAEHRCKVLVVQHARWT